MTKINLLCLISIFSLHTSAYSAETVARSTESLVFNCYTCHGTHGRSPGKIPSLIDIPAEEIKEKLLNFRHDKTSATIMNRIAKGYSEEEINRIADYLATLK